MSKRAATGLHLHEVDGVRLFVTLWGGLALLDIARLVGAAPLLQLAAISLLVAGCSRGVRRATALFASRDRLAGGQRLRRPLAGQLGFVGNGDLMRGLLLWSVALAAAELGR